MMEEYGQEEPRPMGLICRVCVVVVGTPVIYLVALAMVIWERIRGETN
jgi:hypothetical protein